MIVTRECVCFTSYLGQVDTLWLLKGKLLYYHSIFQPNQEPFSSGVSADDLDVADKRLHHPLSRYQQKRSLY